MVPAANLLGDEGKGYKIAIETLNEGRIGIGAQMLGLAEGAWGHAAKYAKERRQFGKPIAEFQAVQFALAEMATEIEAAKLMVYNAARLKDAGQPYVREAAMTKYLRRRWPSGWRASAWRSSAATDLCGIIRRRSTIATRRSERSTKALRICS